ncbi:MAG: tRNA uridine-5-carboxymethylaminomethyl(34) synthesis GTPase MnmE [Paracoccaceae bacterium]|nr:tRNA uridine-5-carboxymethylaminomethyl(34) synthesis GTPase MnmE [Rhodobacterales bacterium]NCX70143.1 tRNA uridine-5-carboxymethylaminomethyl(34) synthesis GTPase MnmE [Paracoccaceae bacterium]NCX90303.1 tRNA uridine-5-carboxymethylaminomethyl(34) synthesis GTPase MnmE [Paracoccaceae bacterium]
MDTIFALASAPGKAGISIVRLSGPLAINVAEKLTKSKLKEKQPNLRVIYDSDNHFIDQALILIFRKPYSFTGENVVEFHLHGSSAVVSSVIKLLGNFKGLRSAEAGEFTRCALENGKIDLAQVEGLADLIDAETDAQHKQAARIFNGALGEKTKEWRAKLVKAGALLVATLDFADEEVPEEVTPEVEKLINMVLSDLDKEIIGVHTAERIRSGFEVAIVGAPNLGKSTLLNYLVGRDAAITSNVSGTTRDVIEVKLDLRGLPVTILDTAGIRKSDDKVEEIGISRALERSSLSDLRIVLTEDGEYPVGLKKRDTDIICIAKDDQGNLGGVSGKTGAGIDRLKNNIWDILNDKAQYVGIATRERHKSSMVNAKKFLGNAVVSLRDGPEYYDITAEEIRAATSALDSLIGRIGVEDVLDEVFSSFCLGK